MNVPAIFLGGPWAGRHDLSVRYGVHVLHTTTDRGEYRYRDRGMYGTGEPAWVGYLWWAAEPREDP
jgi:hypothetical protein